MKNNDFILDQFDEASEILESKLYSDNEMDGIFYTSISSCLGLDESKEMSCLAENLDGTTDNIHTFLCQDHSKDELQYSFTIFFSLMYFAVVRIEVLLKIVEPQKENWHEKIPVFQKITKWMNFIKHPKAFFLCHMPDYYLENDPLLTDALEKANLVIDNDFIFTYYSNGKNRNDVLKLLANEVEVVIVIPNILVLMNDFCDSILEFIELIKTNDRYKETLISYTVLTDI